jgi:hypothetical protein
MASSKPLTRVEAERAAERLRVDARFAYLNGQSAYAKRLSKRADALCRSARTMEAR